jgi:hypothetical protein
MEKPVNKHHAAFLRAKLSRGATPTVQGILARLSDEEIIAKAEAHHQFRLATGGRLACKSPANISGIQLL